MGGSNKNPPYIIQTIPNIHTQIFHEAESIRLLRETYPNEQDQKLLMPMCRIKDEMDDIFTSAQCLLNVDSVDDVTTYTKYPDEVFVNATIKRNAKLQSSIKIIKFMKVPKLKKLRTDLFRIMSDTIEHLEMKLTLIRKEYGENSVEVADVESMTIACINLIETYATNIFNKYSQCIKHWVGLEQMLEQIDSGLANLRSMNYSTVMEDQCQTSSE